MKENDIWARFLKYLSWNLLLTGTRTLGYFLKLTTFVNIFMIPFYVYIVGIYFYIWANISNEDKVKESKILTDFKTHHIEKVKKKSPWLILEPIYFIVAGIMGYNIISLLMFVELVLSILVHFQIKEIIKKEEAK